VVVDMEVLTSIDACTRSKREAPLCTSTKLIDMAEDHDTTHATARLMYSVWCAKDHFSKRPGARPPCRFDPN
jgi:hypothetical protein